jgi:uncharacterized phage protein (TIGR02218 family)
MKSVSTALSTHIALPCTTLATLWKVKRADGVIMGFTNHDKDLIFDIDAATSPYSGDGVTTYYASTGMAASAVETGSDLSIDNLEITAFIDSSAITDTDIRAGRYDYCQISVVLVNYNDLTMGCLRLRFGTIGQVVIKNGLYSAEIRGLSYYFGTVIGYTFGPICRADLGDSKCSPAGEVNLTALSQTGYVSSSTNRRTFVPNAVLTSPLTSLTGAAGYFNQGVLTWLTGLNAGLLMEVDTWDGTTIALFESMPFTITPGDTFKVEPGCNKTTDCFAKFNNIVNKQAEPFIPGTDAIMNYGSL